MPPSTARAKKPAPRLDFNVKDLSLADWGRKEIEHRREGDARPHGAARGVRREAAAHGRRASPAAST